MPPTNIYTAEISWLVPVGLHIQIEAETPAAALAEANRRINDDEVNFDAHNEWPDACSATEVTGLWLGEQSHNGFDQRTLDETFAADLDRAREVAPRAVERMREALEAAESFISGFEGDELQEGIADLLAFIRKAMGEPGQ